MTGDQVSIEAFAAPVEANEQIREWAYAVVADPRSVWEFVCECGGADCTERVKMTIAFFDEARELDQSVLAHGHLRARAQAARDWSAEVRDEAQAVRNQAQQQISRTGRLRSTGTPPYPEMVCDECGYGVCVPNPPSACPVCRSTAWHTR